MKRYFLFLLLLSCPLFSQQLPKDSNEWIESNLKLKDVDSKELLTAFEKYNFSFLWLTNQDATIGYIGTSYQRLYIHLNEIVKNETISSCYLIKGKSRVGNNICDFKGYFKILHIRIINKERREEMLKVAKEIKDQELMQRAKHEHLIVLAEYELYENHSMKWSGIFKGFLKSYFYVENDSIYYDDLELEYSDKYSNNAFDGVWESYETHAEKKCCWGNYRVPNVGDLDIGASEFSPNEKYLKNGWDNYYKAYIIGNPSARKEEDRKWW